MSFRFRRLQQPPNLRRKLSPWRIIFQTERRQRRILLCRLDILALGDGFAMKPIFGITPHQFPLAPVSFDSVWLSFVPVFFFVDRQLVLIETPLEAVNHAVTHRMDLRHKDTPIAYLTTPNIIAGTVNRLIGADHPAVLILLGNTMHLSLEIRFDQVQRAVVIPVNFPAMLFSVL